jgi:hypothetical protein
MNLNLFEHERFSLNDLSSRWKKARISAIKKSQTFDQDQFNIQNESELLLKVTSENKDLVLRAVYDHSRLLGLSLVKHLGLTLEITDIAQLLPQMDSPCFSAVWRPHHEAQVLERKACRDLAVLGNFACDYWREAVDGLVVGVGENERFTRHRSVGHGDEDCCDVLFEEKFTPPRVVTAEENTSSSKLSKSLKYGPLPEVLMTALVPVQERFRKLKINLVLEGLSEGILYYRLDADEGVLCGAGGKMLHESFLKELENIKSQNNLKLIARDCAPLAVYGGSN